MGVESNSTWRASFADLEHADGNMSRSSVITGLRKKCR